MLLKAIAVFTLVGICMAEEHAHAYSSQSIVLHQTHGHESHHENEHHHEHEYHHEPVVVSHEDSHHHEQEYHHQPIVIAHHNEHEYHHQPIIVAHHSEHEYHHQPIVVSHHNEHEYHHQPIVVSHHNEHEYHHQPIVVAHHEPVKVEVEKHEVAEVVPVLTKVVPVAHYVQESSGHVEHKSHDGHKPALSSFHIERHDVPAHPPKDFHQYDGPAKYEFAYQVHDPHTGDFKEQHESRNGHVVEGVYSLHEHDGSIRTVKYHADKKTGFNAEVSHSTKHIEEHKHH